MSLYEDHFYLSKQTSPGYGPVPTAVDHSVLRLVLPLVKWRGPVGRLFPFRTAICATVQADA